jgi:hypothetical protein
MSSVDCGAAAIPRLSISCSSREGRVALENWAAWLLDRMPLELAERIARTVFILALDKERHAGFAQRLGRSEDVTTRLVQEQVRQGGRRPHEILTIVVMQLVRPFHLEHNVLTLAHELGHAALGHTVNYEGVVAMGQGAIDAIEREAEAFALRYVRGDGAGV